MVYGDADRIRQVADNLLTNAIKFTRNGTVCFRVSHKDVVMTMEVEDSGIGMDKETIERIFRRLNGRRQTFRRKASGSAFR